MGIVEGGIKIDPNLPLFLEKLVIQIGLLVSFDIDSGEDYSPIIEIISSNGAISSHPIPWPPPVKENIKMSHYPKRVGLNVRFKDFSVGKSGTIIVKLSVGTDSVCIGSLECWPISDNS